MSDKIIVSNRSALKAKYGAAGAASIDSAVKKLIAADALRGIDSRRIFLDSAAAMKSVGGKAVANPRDPRENKAAIDAIFRAHDPEYVMILGAPDVIPHQDLANPVFDATNDPDRSALGDLPYACEAPYSRDIAAFKGPSRVVGRLPDMTGARDPVHLIKLLSNATKYKSRPADDYVKNFSLSAFQWRKSTTLSISNVFGNSDSLLLSPPDGPNHAVSRLAPLSHFINCHGGMADPSFVGQRGTSYPTALTSGGIAGKISPGTVASVECCYGAELYDSEVLALPLPICQQYLRDGAYGYFGSTTIAYGPEEGNGAADLITQYFLLAVLEGASLGRAALIARQQFVQQVTELDPIDLKTLAQFNLLGDPSVHPATVDNATVVPKGIAADTAFRMERRARRAKLRAMSEFLGTTKPTASKVSKSVRRSATVRRALANICLKAGLSEANPFRAFNVKTPPGGRRAAGAKGVAPVIRYHIAVGVKTGSTGRGARDRVAVVARELEGRIVGYRIYLKR